MRILNYLLWRQGDQKWRLLHVIYQSLKVFLNSNLRIVEHFEIFDVQALGPELGPFTVLYQFYKFF